MNSHEYFMDTNASYAITVKDKLRVKLKMKTKQTHFYVCLASLYDGK